MIKIWNFGSGELRLSFTGHVSTVRGHCADWLYLPATRGEDKVRHCRVLYAAWTLTSKDLDG